MPPRRPLDASPPPALPSPYPPPQPTPAAAPGTFPTFVPMLNIDLGDLNATVDNGGELTLTREMGDFEKGELGGFSVSGDFDSAC